MIELDMGGLVDRLHHPGEEEACVLLAEEGDPPRPVPDFLAGFLYGVDLGCGSTVEDEGVLGREICVEPAGIFLSEAADSGNDVGVGYGEDGEAGRA